MAKITYKVIGGSPPTISPTPGQIEVRRGDFLEFTRASGTTAPILVQLAGAGGSGPKVDCLVPTPDQAVSASVAVAAISGSIVVSFTAVLPVPAMPSPRPIRHFEFSVSATGAVSPSIAGTIFVTGDFFTFKRDATHPPAAPIFVELTASGPNIFFEIAPHQRSRRVGVVFPPPTGSGLVITFSDNGGVDPGNGPLP